MSAKKKHQDIFLGFKPLKHEDSKGPGIWDAKKRGNHKGKSFTVNSKNKVTYLKPPKKHTAAAKKAIKKTRGSTKVRAV